jgi:hypothetical protein
MSKRYSNEEIGELIFRILFFILMLFAIVFLILDI